MNEYTFQFRSSIINLLLSFLCLLSITSYSQDENYDAVYLRLTKEYTLNPDGSQEFRYIKQLKLQTYRSFHNLYGETFVVYNPDFQSLKINESSTVMANGVKIIAPKNSFNEVLPSMAANAPVFNKLREMVITHTATERNALVNLDYTIHSKPGLIPVLMGNELLAENEPIKELTVVVKIPSMIKLNYKILNTDQVPVVTNDGQFSVYTWKFLNVPAISQEELQRPANDLYPRLIFSTDRDRKLLYSTIMVQPTASFVPDEEMKKAVNAVLSEQKDQMDIVLKLQEKVVNEFRLWPIPMKYCGFVLRPAAETWHSNGGIMAEKAILLIALLKEAGIPSFPVYVVRNSLFDENLGTLLDIEDVIVKTDLKESGPVYLSVTTLNPQNLKYTYPDRVFIEMNAENKPEFRKTEVYKNKIILNGIFEFYEKKQLKGDLSAGVFNGTNPWLQLQRDKSKAKSIFGGGIASGDLKEQKIATIGQEESVVAYSVQKEKPFHQDSLLSILVLPLASNGIESLGIHLLPAKRETPLEINSGIEEKYDFSVAVPEGMLLFSPETKKEVSNSAGTFSYELKNEGKKLRIKRSIVLEKKLIRPEEYGEFKALMDLWNFERYREVVFVKDIK